MYRDDVVRRFWEKVAMPEDPGDLLACWEWCGSCPGASGAKIRYGQAWDGTKLRPAHVLAWEIYYGDPVPAGMQVRHNVCRNSLCVRPHHLALGSRAQNMEDMVRDGRSCRGERHFNAQFTRKDIRDIRASSERPRDLAIKYGVLSGTISNIRARRTWAWLPD